MLFNDIFQSFRSPIRWVFTTWFNLLIRYRRTAIGPLWIIASPVLFIFCLGALFLGLSNMTSSEFMPHLTIGLVNWTLLGGFVGRGHDLFTRNNAYLYQGETKYTDIILMDNAELIVHYLHQAVLILAVCIFYKTIKSPYALLSLLGFLIVILNGFWISVVLGILGSRFKDIGEILDTIITMAFLATPIIWMPVRNTAPVGRDTAPIFETYMRVNPFYHYMEIIRAPLMNLPIAPLTWIVVGVTTILGYIVATIMYWRYRHMLVIWN